MADSWNSHIFILAFLADGGRCTFIASSWAWLTIIIISVIMILTFLTNCWKGTFLASPLANIDLIIDANESILQFCALSVSIASLTNFWAFAAFPFLVGIEPIIAGDTDIIIFCWAFFAACPTLFTFAIIVIVIILQGKVIITFLAFDFISHHQAVSTVFRALRTHPITINVVPCDTFIAFILVSVVTHLTHRFTTGEASINCMGISWVGEHTLLALRCAGAAATLFLTCQTFLIGIELEPRSAWAANKLIPTVGAFLAGRAAPLTHIAVSWGYGEAIFAFRAWTSITGETVIRAFNTIIVCEIVANEALRFRHDCFQLFQQFSEKPLFGVI